MQEKRHDRVVEMRLCFFLGKVGDYNVSFVETRMCRSTDKPTIVWDFHSLMLALQMMFSFMITDENSTLKLCKHCGKIFVASRSNVQFCSPQCKNQHNVYKCRAKREDSE